MGMPVSCAYTAELHQTDLIMLRSLISHAAPALYSMRKIKAYVGEVSYMGMRQMAVMLGGRCCHHGRCETRRSKLATHQRIRTAHSTVRYYIRSRGLVQEVTSDSRVGTANLSPRPSSQVGVNIVVEERAHRAGRRGVANLG